MTDLEKAARMALEALEYYQIAGLATTRVVDSIAALRQAISDSVKRPAQQSAERVEPVDWEAVAADQAMTIAMMKVAQEAAVLAEREALEEMDWTWLMRQGALVTWDDAETLGDRVRAAIRERNIK